MAIYKCGSCQARNDEGGRCILCGKSLGSLHTAVLAATVGAALFGICWVLVSLTGLQILWVAALYGMVVSGAVAHFSGGRGIHYQLVATSFTILGIVAFDTLVVWIHWQQLAHSGGVIPLRPGFLELMEFQFENDPYTGLFCVFGVIGGFWIWK